MIQEYFLKFRLRRSVKGFHRTKAVVSKKKRKLLRSLKFPMPLSCNFVVYGHQK